jgi:hypothetical protein
MRRWEGSPGFGTEDEAGLIQPLETCPILSQPSDQHLQKPYVKGRLGLVVRVALVLVFGQ